MSETANSTVVVRCKRCDRKLTKPESIERRMGKICAALDKDVAERLQRACAAGLEAFMQGA